MPSTKESVLWLLENARGESLSGQQLAQRLGVSRTAVWKAVEALKGEGHRIEAVSNRGYRLRTDSDVLTSSALAPWLPAGYDPALLHVYDQVESTNTTAKQLAAAGAPEGTFVVASRQSGGKGRRGRSFFSPQGGVYCSIVLRPNLPAEESTRITTAAAVQVCRTIEEVCTIQPAIKWVNDLLVEGKKICGILTEASLDLETGMPEYVVLGVGVNLCAPEGFPAELDPIAGALYGQLPPGLTRGRFAAELLARLWGISALCTQDQVIEEYRRRCPLVGRTVRVVGEAPRSARVLGITDSCGLLVEYADGARRELHSGEVSIRPAEEGWDF